jgi:hypothetical protein
MVKCEKHAQHLAWIQTQCKYLLLPWLRPPTSTPALSWAEKDLFAWEVNTRIPSPCPALRGPQRTPANAASYRRETRSGGRAWVSETWIQVPPLLLPHPSSYLYNSTKSNTYVITKACYKVIWENIYKVWALLLHNDPRGECVQSLIWSLNFTVKPW